MILVVVGATIALVAIVESVTVAVVPAGLVVATVVPAIAVAAGDEEEEMVRILSNADRMNAELVQRGLKTIIRRSTAIEIDTMVGNWSFIAVGALPFYQGLVKAGETDMLRRNPKLSAWFFVPPLHDDSLAVTDALIELLRNEGVAVKREILQ